MISGDPDSITVSGHREGATFACSLQIILSEEIKGAGCIKGGTFALDPNDLDEDADFDDLFDETIEKINDLDADGKIDSVDNLQTDSDRAVILITSSDDEEFFPVYQEAMSEVFFDYGMDFSELFFDDDTGSAIFNRMSTQVLEYLYDSLGYTDPGDFLDWQDSDEDFEDLGEYDTFDQTEFAPNADFTTGDLADKQEGYYYIPDQCNSDVTCRVHVVFHRANSPPTFLAEDRGYNLLGALNDIIMVYPNTVMWDMQGVDGDNKDGEVIQLVLGIIKRVTGRTTEDTCEAVFDDASDNLDQIEDFLEGTEDSLPTPFDESRLDVCDTDQEKETLQARAVRIFETTGYKARFFQQIFYGA